jgi:hypothetical protein
MTDRQHSGRATLVRGAAITMVAGLLLAAGCSGGSEEGQAATTSTTLPASTTTTTSAPATTPATVPPTTSTTVPPAAEPPVIELAGSSTVYSQDGHPRVSGWLDRPAAVTVGGTSVEVYDDQYDGISTFETVLNLEPGSHRIPITATDSRGLESEIVLSVLVEPALEMQLAMIQDVDLVERTVVADYVEFLTGDEATTAAREDGVIGDDEQTPGGFYLRNRNPKLRTLTLGDPGVVTVQACFLEKGPCAADHAVNIDTWVKLLSNPDMAEKQLGWFWYGAGLAPYWLALQDGVIVQITEQYLP